MSLPLFSFLCIVSSWEVSSLSMASTFILIPWAFISPFLALHSCSADHEPGALQILQMPRIKNGIQHFSSPQLATSGGPYPDKSNQHPLSHPGQKSQHHLRLFLFLLAFSLFLVPSLVSSHVFLMVIPLIFVSFFLCLFLFRCPYSPTYTTETLPYLLLLILGA